MADSVVVEIPYRPRQQFTSYHERSQRWAFLLAHRRAGKTVATVNDILARAVRDGIRDASYAYMAPYHVQAKDIAWLYLKKYTAPLLRFGGKINESELSITLPSSQSIRLYGAENGERVRGKGFAGLVCDEYQDFPPHLWGEVLLPTLADSQGWATIIGTAKGRMNDFYRKRQEAQGPGWYLSLIHI